LGQKFQVKTIPFLIVLSSSLETITTNGIEELSNAPEEALRQWSQGKPLFWSREPQEGEFVWKDSSCSKCFMKPLIGLRHSCTNKECQIDLCQTCRNNNNHEHPLVEYLIPNRQYSLEQFLLRIPYLLNPKNEEKIPAETIYKNDIKSVGFYFSANWCPPCRAFTPQLIKLYNEIQETSHPFHILYISFSQGEDLFNKYRLEMPWPAVPLNSNQLFVEYFQVSSES